MIFHSLDKSILYSKPATYALEDYDRNSIFTNLLFGAWVRLLRRRIVSTLLASEQPA